MPRRLLAAALTAAAFTALAPLAPASAKPCELGCIIKCIESTVVSFCPPVAKA